MCVQVFSFRILFSERRRLLRHICKQFEDLNTLGRRGKCVRYRAVQQTAQQRLQRVPSSLLHNEESQSVPLVLAWFDPMGACAVEEYGLRLEVLIDAW